MGGAQKRKFMLQPLIFRGKLLSRIFFKQALQKGANKHFHSSKQTKTGKFPYQNSQLQQQKSSPNPKPNQKSVQFVACKEKKSILLLAVIFGGFTRILSCHKSRCRHMARCFDGNKAKNGSHDCHGSLRRNVFKNKSYDP